MFFLLKKRTELRRHSHLKILLKENVCLMATTDASFTDESISTLSTFDADLARAAKDYTTQICYSSSVYEVQFCKLF